MSERVEPGRVDRLTRVEPCRQGTADLIEENANEALHRQNSIKDNAGVTGAAAFDGAKTAATRRPKGRKGMEGMLVRHDKSFLTMLQDFYVACLKVSLFPVRNSYSFVPILFVLFEEFCI